MKTDRYQNRVSRFISKVVVLFIFPWMVYGEKAILLHKNENFSSWDWLARFEFGPWSGWSHDSNSGRYMVCDVSATKVNHTNSWLVSEYVDSHDAKAVHVELEFVARQCPSGYPYCKQSFNVYALQTNDPVVGGITETEVESGNFIFVGSVNATSLWTPGMNAIQINQANLTMAVSPGAVLYIGFQDSGACVALVSVTVSYAYCPEVVNHGAVFKRTPAPSISQSNITVNGNCSDKALAYPGSSSLVLTCLSSGQWLDDSKVTCLCSPGYELVGDSCFACRAGFNKGSVGNEKCLPCPANSQSSSSRDSCPCQSGFYRAPQDANNDSCTAPPSAPKDINITAVTDSVAVIAWSRPEFDGGRADVKYDLRCSACPNMGSCSSSCLGAMFVPSAVDVKIPQVTMSNLDTDVLYNITVISKNGVSDQAGLSSLKFLHKTFSLTKAVTSIPPSTPASALPNMTEANTEAVTTRGKGNLDTNVSGAIRISVAVTFAICFIVSAIIILLLAKFWKKRQFKSDSRHSSLAQLFELSMDATQLKKLRSVTTTTELSDIDSRAELQERTASPNPLIKDANPNASPDYSANNNSDCLDSRKPLPVINIHESNSDLRASSARDSSMTSLKKTRLLPKLNWTPPRTISPVLLPSQIRRQDSSLPSHNRSPRNSPEGSEVDRSSPVSSWYPVEDVQYNI